MARLAKLSARYMGDRGFSIGIEDVTPPPGLLAIKATLIRQGKDKADAVIAQYKKGTLQLQPGCDALQSLESEVAGILGRIRQQCGDEAMNELIHTNAALCMAQAGSKGSPLNISQMVSCLGQQSVAGSRIQNGFEGRTLPHFETGSLSPDAKVGPSDDIYVGPNNPNSNPNFLLDRCPGVCWKQFLLGPHSNRVFLPHHGGARGTC